MRTITFLTDFGTKDGYAASVKGRILRMTPGVRIMDITHDIDPFRIDQAAYTLFNYYDSFPKGTIHLAVVDPGVGSSRAGLLIQSAKYFFIGPDNGIFSAIYDREGYTAYLLNDQEIERYLPDNARISRTFHARDIFGPAAALLAQEIPVRKITRMVSGSFKPVVLPPAEIKPGNRIDIRINAVDRFGNIITSFHRDQLPLLKKIRVSDVTYKNFETKQLAGTYSDVPTGSPLVLWGSSGFLEIAVNKGSAADYFDSHPNEDRIELTLE